MEFKDKLPPSFKKFRPNTFLLTKKLSSIKSSYLPQASSPVKRCQNIFTPLHIKSSVQTSQMSPIVPPQENYGEKYVITKINESPKPQLISNSFEPQAASYLNHHENVAKSVVDNNVANGNLEESDDDVIEIKNVDKNVTLMINQSTSTKTRLPNVSNYYTISFQQRLNNIKSNAIDGGVKESPYVECKERSEIIFEEEHKVKQLQIVLKRIDEHSLFGLRINNLNRKEENLDPLTASDSEDEIINEPLSNLLSHNSTLIINNNFQNLNDDLSTTLPIPDRIITPPLSQIETVKNSTIKKTYQHLVESDEDDESDYNESTNKCQNSKRRKFDFDFDVKPNVNELPNIPQMSSLYPEVNIKIENVDHENSVEDEEKVRIVFVSKNKFNRTCKFCPKSFKGAMMYFTHLSRRHQSKMNSVESFICCGRLFTHLNGLESHLKSHKQGRPKLHKRRKFINDSMDTIIL